MHPKYVIFAKITLWSLEVTNDPRELFYALKLVNYDSYACSS